MNLYANIMEEVKVRIAAIDSGTGGYLLTLPPAIVREHCFLQLRMICELIAFGCLVAHGDIEQTQAPKFQKQWAADRIMEELEKLHPHFYPQAVRRSREEYGFRVDAINPSPCPKDELLRIYHECGDTLHRGNLKKLMSQTKPIVVHYPRITAVAQKIINLLQHHVVFTFDGKLVFVCTLRNEDDHGRVQVAIAEASDVPPQLLGIDLSAPA